MQGIYISDEESTYKTLSKLPTQATTNTTSGTLSKSAAVTEKLSSSDMPTVPLDSTESRMQHDLSSLPQNDDSSTSGSSNQSSVSYEFSEITSLLSTPRSLTGKKNCH
ncbi:uncharacterized protein LOC142340321 [Convolutriloba macropyga]|uniref:uncharacterized protein LOC142340321 n=1 Tax=Convolutriloba macropyga TaxID=536237 RepID=UPI003F520C13